MEAKAFLAQRWRTLGTLAGFIFAALVGAGLVASRPLVAASRDVGGAPPEVPARRLNKLIHWSKSHCQTYPWLKFDKVLYSHLGNKGPKLGGGDGEGLVYRTIDMGTGAGAEEGRKVLLIINATNKDYKPFSPKRNGMQGFYGSVNLHSNSHLNLKMSFRDEKTGKPLTMADLAITFFDLDAGHDGRSTESVAINNFKHWYLTDETEVQRSEQEHGMTKYAASTYGTGEDNPYDPMRLTHQQKNRAVTLLYKHVDKIDVTLKATANTHISPRFFTFVLRPSLLCAITLTKGQKPPLEALDYVPPMELPCVVPDGMYFKKWTKEVGDHVHHHHTIALVTDKFGKDIELKAQRNGTIKELAKLEPHESCDERLADTTIAVIKMDRIHPLYHDTSYQQGALAKKGETFVRYKKLPGSSVRKNDVIAIVEDEDGEEEKLRAPHDGVIRDEQKLHKGDPIQRVDDLNLATYKREPELKPKGWRVRALNATDTDLIFKKWLVKEGDHVDRGTPIIEAEKPGDGRRLGEATTIPAQLWGTIEKKQHLEPGAPIRAQMHGSTVATVNLGWPWWFYLLPALAAICCVLCCLLAVMMMKPKPTYAPMPPVEEEPLVEEPKEEPPPPPPPPKPDGLRLDFEDKGEVQTVYAKRRPLGIKHENIAPIVAHQFTLNSYAKQELGVKEGWKLTRIDDHELEDSNDFKAVNDELNKYMKDFRLWPLPITFLDGNKKKVEVKFVERPLGMEFTNQAPIKAAKIHEGSPAAEQGVQEGWEVIQIGEMDVAENVSFRTIMGYLHEGVQPLDEGKTYD